MIDAGPTWPPRPILASSLLDVDSPIAQALVERPGPLIAAQTSTLTVELAAVLACAGGWVRNVVLTSLAAFHGVSYVLLENVFAGFVGCCAAFFRLEGVPRRSRPLLAPRFSEAVDVG